MKDYIFRLSLCLEKNNFIAAFWEFYSVFYYNITVKLTLR
jgi:hypothetical protein